jgi:hypothetical protein
LLYTTIRLIFLVAEYFLYGLKYIKAIFEVIMSLSYFKDLSTNGTSCYVNNLRPKQKKSHVR